MKKKLGDQNCNPGTLKPGDKFQIWRKLADDLMLSEQEKLRVEWMIHYEKEAKGNVKKTCKYFGISRKTFYKWLNRFTDSEKNIGSLKNTAGKPPGARNWEVSIEQEKRIVNLRKKNIHYSKKKLKVLYMRKYSEEISCWKIERVIRKHKLYPDREKQKVIAGTLIKEKEKPKRSFTKLVKEKKLWFLFHMMIIKIHWQNTKRYIIIAVEHTSKLGFVRMYKMKSSWSLNDFLFRINHFIQQPFENFCQKKTDEIAHLFEITINQSKTTKFFSWVNSSKNNIEIDRFGETFEYEWLYDGNLDMDCVRFNKNVISWLIEYNFNRPHQSLNYFTPIEYIEKELNKVLQEKNVSPEDIVDTVIEYILSLNIEELETLSVKRISSEVGISQSRLWRYFKQAKRMTLKELLVRIKIHQAANLLQNRPESTVKEIAEKTGFYCYDYFFRVFKKHFGITPQKYRELKKGIGMVL